MKMRDGYLGPFTLIDTPLRCLIGGSAVQEA